MGNAPALLPWPLFYACQRLSEWLLRLSDWLRPAPLHAIERYAFGCAYSQACRALRAPTFFDVRVAACPCSMSTHELTSTKT